MQKIKLFDVKMPLLFMTTTDFWKIQCHSQEILLCQLEEETAWDTDAKKIVLCKKCSISGPLPRQRTKTPIVGQVKHTQI